jgi:hypothetical protein
MSKFRKRPVIIEAFQWHGEYIPGFKIKRDSTGRVWLQILTLEGIMEASEGDWIITGIKGEQYPCKDDIFQMTYEPVSEE